MAEDDDIKAEVGLRFLDWVLLIVTIVVLAGALLYVLGANIYEIISLLF